MNNLPEKDNNQIEEEVFSTVFSNPVEHKKVSATPKKKRLKIVLALILVFSILIGGTVAVIKLIPEKQVEEPEENEEILVLNREEELIKSIVVKNENGTFKFLCRTEMIEAEEEGAESTESTVWYLDGVDEDLTSSDLISDVVFNLTYIKAIREITTKNEKQCGLDKPRAQATLNLEGEEITILIGDVSPDNVGNYLKLSTSDKIYLVEEGIGESLIFSDLDFASADMENPLELGKKYSDYYTDDTLAKVDKITAWGSHYENELVFVQNKDSQLASYVPYNLIKPTERPAENVVNLFSVFSSGFYLEGAYTYTATAKDIKDFGLNSPDYILSATFDDLTYTYKFKKQSDGYYAVIGNNSKNIKKVSTEACGFLTCDPNYFISKTVFSTNIGGVKNLKFITKDKTYSFDISENPSGDENNKYIIKCDGKTYESSNFQSFYQYLCLLEVMEFDVKNTNLKPELSIVYTYDDKNKETTTIDFVKLNTTKYQYSINGVALGKIGSTKYKKILKLLDTLLEGKTVVVN